VVAPHSSTYIQTVTKSCSCRCKRTKYCAGTDKKRRYRRSDDNADVIIAELECG